jgi:hypothetical protein
MVQTRKEIWCLTHTSDHRSSYSRFIVPGSQSSWTEHHRISPVSISCDSNWDIVPRSISCPTCGRELRVEVVGRWLSYLMWSVLCLALTATVAVFAWWVFRNVKSTGWILFWLVLSGAFVAGFIFTLFDISRSTFARIEDVPLICFRRGDWGGHRIQEARKR